MKSLSFQLLKSFYFQSENKSEKHIKETISGLGMSELEEINQILELHFDQD